MIHFRKIAIPFVALGLMAALTACGKKPVTTPMITPSAHPSPQNTISTTPLPITTVSPLMTDPLVPPLTTDVPQHTNTPEHSPGNSPAAPIGSPVTSPLTTAGLSSGESQRVQRLANKLLDITEVESGAVIATDEVCLAAVTYGEQFKGTMASNLIERIKLELQSVEGTGSVMAVTAEPAQVQQVVALAQKIDQGNVTQSMLDEFDALVRQVLGA
nr:YhcN/YlaJ family sporulation lipoprotein [bacterium]